MYMLLNHTITIGRKRFLLFDPNESPNVYPYPFLHPSHGQCQVNIDEPDFTTYPNQRQLKAYVADLGPGDMLYLPPLWFHSVLSVDQCISISVWSVSHEQDIFDQYGHPSHIISYHRTSLCTNNDCMCLLSYHSVIQATVKSVDKDWTQSTKRAFAYNVITDVLNGIANQHPNANDTRGSIVGGWETNTKPAAEYVRRMRDERYGPSVTSGQISSDLVGGVDICNKQVDDDVKRRVDRLVDYAIELFGPISVHTRTRMLIYIPTVHKGYIMT
jgi:hypothetical protein